MNNLLDAMIAAKLAGGGGGGGEVTPAAIVTATGQMDETQKSDTLTNLGAEPQKLIVTITESGGIFSANKTLAELNAARTAGKNIVFSYDDFVAPAVYLSDSSYRATIVNLNDDGVKTSVFSIYYNKFGVYGAQDGPFADIPITITCTMTSLSGGTWSGATFDELQAACAAGRLLNANVVGVANVTAFMQDFNAGTAVGTSPFMTPSEQYGLVILFRTGDFIIRFLVTPDPTVVTDLSSTSKTITPAPNTVYKCGELTSLTISNPPAVGKYAIIFSSGSTATTTIGIENFIAEANKRYKITVEDNYATYDSWPYTPT